MASNNCTGAEHCELDGTGKLAIAASLLWFVCAALMFVSFRIKNRGVPGATPGVEQSTTSTEREVRTVTNLDGSTTTITKTTVRTSDGSTTVTETTEVAEAPVAESTPVAVAESEESASAIPLATATVAPIQEAAVMSVENDEQDDTPEPVDTKGIP